MARMTAEEKAAALMREFREAYAAANEGRQITIRYHRGWFAITERGWTEKCRASQVRTVIREMRASSARFRSCQIGQRFRRMRFDPLTGQVCGFQTYTVVEVEPKPSMLPQRVVLERDGDGFRCRPDIGNLWSELWQAIDNITPLFRRANSAGIEVREVET